MKKNSIVFLLPALFLNANAIAGDMGVVVPADWRSVYTLSIGPVWQDNAQTQTFFLTPTIEKTFTNTNSNNTLFDAEIFLGMQKIVSPTFQAQLGLAIAATSNAKIAGNIWDDADPRFNNFTYNYKIQHTHVALKGKLLANADYWVTPWISASLGVGFNRSHQYQSTPLIFEALPVPAFNAQTETAFTYTLGLGVQKVLNDNWQIGVGYEFADWGKSNLGYALGQNLSNYLHQDHLYTNGVMFNLTYLI